MGFAAIGTDTAGSVREPAAACGIVGFKPTYGRVSVDGVIPLSISLDHVGPLTTTVADAAAIFDAIAESNPKAAPGIAGQQPSSTPGTRNLRIGVPRNYFFDELDPEISAAVEDALRTLKKIVSQVSDIELVVPEDRSLQSAESYAYHAESVARAPELYDPETLRRIRTGEKYSAEDRARAIAELQQERRKIQLTFSEVDALVTPTLPISPPRIADLKQHPEKLRPAELLLLRNTRPFNVWGLPAISIPCGFTSAGLPIGLQIAGPHWGDSTVLAVARAYERVTEWHKNKPSL
jgi:Asp-tRNA(Asn)/Glu-tRNA(Gln) amidotransferase A subunit family amidase